MVNFFCISFVVSFEIMVLNVKTTAQNLQLIKFSSEIIYNQGQIQDEGKEGAGDAVCYKNLAN